MLTKEQYDPQASLEAYERIETQRTPTDAETMIRAETALVIVALVVMILIALCLVWALC